MHVLIAILVVAILLILAYRVFAAAPAGPGGQPIARSARGLAFLSNGTLYYRPPGGNLQPLESEFVQEAIDRRERSRERHGWKQGTSFGITAGGGHRDFSAADKPMQATAAAFASNGDLFYFLRDDSVGGLFRRIAASGSEMRLLLKNKLNLRDLTPAPDGACLAASSQQVDGVANIALFDGDGSRYRELTGGDTVDSAPAWIPGVPERLLFQSAGLARDERGYLVAQGPASIQMLNMGSGAVSTVLENPRYDFLKPRVCPAGRLHFIRRPYEVPRYAPETLLTDLLLFPFRLLRAVFHYLNFFSLMYTRKPLTSANGPAVQADLKNILLQGRRIDAEKALRNERPVRGVPSLVPSSWELVSRATDGSETVLATNVASYDVAPDGTIIYSNGHGVFVLERDGTVGLALQDQLIAEVFAAAA